MYQFKTVFLFIGLSVACSQSFAHSNATECAAEIMKREGICSMQNRFNCDSIAGKGMIKILNFCASIYPSSEDPNNSDAKLETLECTDKQPECNLKPTDQTTTVEI